MTLHRIQSECGENTDQKNSEYGHFSRSVNRTNINLFDVVNSKAY